MPTRTKRITNPDGTVTVHKISDEDTKPEDVKPEDVKPEAAWGDGQHPDKKPHTGSSALDRKWEKAERDRKRRLLGHDGGPKEGDIRSANDESLAKAAERRRRMRILRGDPVGTSSQEGTRRADWLLTESKNKDDLKAWVGGATGERPDLWGEKYRPEDRQRINYERSAEAGGEDWEKWSGDFKGFTGSDPTGTWADDRQTITAAEESYEKDEERYRTDFRELTGQDSTGEPDQDQMLINFYERRNLGLPKSTDPVTEAERETALVEIAKKQERYRTEFRAYTGQDSTGDPDQDQLIINFYERRSLGLPKSTGPITEAEREELQAKRDHKRTEYERQFLVYTGQPSTGDPERDAEIINAERRKTAGQLPALEYRDDERDRQAGRRAFLQWAAENGLRITGADFNDPKALQQKVDTFIEGKRLYADQVEAAERRELQAWAAGQGLHLTDADFEDPAALRSKIEVFVAGKQANADLVRRAEDRTKAQDLATRVALSQSGVTSVPGPPDGQGFGVMAGQWVMGAGGVVRPVTGPDGLLVSPQRGWVPTQPNVLQRTGDPASVVTGAGLDAFAEQHPYINIDGGWWPTKKIIEANVRPATDARGRSAGKGEHQYYNSDRVAEILNRLTLQGRASTTHETPLVEGKARDPQPAPGAPIPQVEAHDPPESGFTGAMLGVWASQPEVQTAEVAALDTIAGASSAVHLVRVDLESRSPEGPGDALILPGERATAWEVAGLGIEIAAEGLPVVAIARAGAGVVRTGARTFGPRQITIPFTDKVIRGPGGFVNQATPDVPVPRLLLSKDDPAAEAISGEVFKEIGATGRVEGLYGNTEFSYTPTPFGEVMHAANPDSVLHLSSTGHSDLVALGPPAKAKPDKGPAEQYFFVQEGDVTSRFMPGSAFNRTGGKSPGIHVYSDLDAAAVGSEFVRVVEADGTIKQWPRRGSFEVERGIQSGDNIPPSYRESTVGIPGGQLYLAEYVALPSYRQRVAANLKAIFDFKNSQRGKFQYRTVSDLEDLSPAGRQRLEERFQAARQAKEAEFQQGLSDGTFTPADRDAVFRSVDDDTWTAISREQAAFDAAAPERAALEARARRAVEDLRRMALTGETPAVRAAAIAALRALERDGVLSTDRSQNQGERGQSEARTDGPEVVTSQPPRISQSGTEGADRLTEPPLREDITAPVFVPLTEPPKREGTRAPVFVPVTEPPLREDITAPVFVPEDIGTPPVVPRVPGAPPSLSTGGVRVPPPILQDITVPSLPAGRDVGVPLPVDRDIGITTPDDRDVGIRTPRDRDIRIPQQRDLDDDSPSRRPDLGAPPVGEEGYTEEDEYPRVVAHTKVVEVQTALNDGDTVETPLEVKNFRVVATGRRPLPGKLLEGRHVEIETDSTGDPKPLMRPPTRHRRRSLNKPPLGPQSRRQPRSGGSRQSGVPMLRRIGPRIGRRR